MNKYEELKMLQKYVQQYRKSLEENLEVWVRDINGFKDINIEDTKEIGRLGWKLSKKEEITEQLEKCDKLLEGLAGAEISYTSASINEKLEDREKRETGLKTALYRLKAQYKGTLSETFLNLSYEYGSYGDLQTEEQQEEFEAELDRKLDGGYITQEDYDALTYGIGFCLGESEQENADAKPIEEESKVSYNSQADRGDNSYEELQAMKTRVELYIQRMERDFESTKEYASKLGLDKHKIESLQRDASNKQMATGILNELKNLEMFMNATATMEADQAQKLFKKQFQEFKETNFNELTTIMSDAYTSLRYSKREYGNVYMTADPRVQSTEEIEAELKELLDRGKISKEDYDEFVYTMGYYREDCIRSGEEVKPTQDLGKEVLDELKNTQYIDETEAGMDRDEKKLDDKTTEYTQED